MKMNSQRPLVSIVITTYNGERFLREQLNSIVTQTYQPLEIIVVDDGSTDDTLNILNGYATNHENFTVIQNEKNLGYVKNFEKGFSLATGDYIAPCDQDDIWLTNKIEVLVNHIQDHAIVYCDSEFIDGSGKSLHQKMSDTKTLTHFDNPLMYLEPGISALGHAMLIKKEIVFAAMPFPTVLSHDNWLGFVATLTSSVEFVDSVLVQYRRHETNLTNALHKKDRKKNIPKKTRRERLENAQQRLAVMYEKCLDGLPEKKVIGQFYSYHESASLRNNFLRMYLFFQHRDKILRHKKYRYPKLKRCLHSIKLFFKTI